MFVECVIYRLLVTHAQGSAEVTSRCFKHLKDRAVATRNLFREQNVDFVAMKLIT